MQAQQSLAEGVVIKFDDERGFGLIRHSLTLEELFFHITTQGSLVGDIRAGEFALMMGGCSDRRPQVDDRMVFIVGETPDRGRHATIWLYERDYIRQLQLLRQRDIQHQEGWAQLFPLVSEEPANGHVVLPGWDSHRRDTIFP